MDFSSEDKASDVKFLHSGSGASWAGNLPFWGTLLPQKPKIGQIGARRVDVGSAFVDNHQSPSPAVLVFYFFCFVLCIKWFHVCIANMTNCGLSVVSNICLELSEILLVTVHTDICDIFTLC